MISPSASRAMRRFAMRAIVLAGTAALAACSLTPRYERPALPVPARYTNTAGLNLSTRLAASPDAASAAQWWRRFGNAELDSLVAEALAANYDLVAAVARIEQSRASLRAARASLLPTVTASVGGSTGRNTSDGSFFSDSNGDGLLDSFADQAALSVGYELDLFGANAAGADAARLGLAATTYNRDAAALVVQADVATAYVQILATEERLAIAQQNLDAGAQLLRLVEVRLREGSGTALEVAQQRGSQLGIEASIAALRQSLVQSQTALAVLLGRAPGGFTVQGRSLAALTLPTATPGTPAELLTRRPDLRVAEANLQAANADIGAARAALFPNVTLSASAGVSGALSSGAGTALSLGAALAQTIFDAGRRRAQVTLSEARQRELAANYAQVVLGALKEVEDALVALDTGDRRAALLDASAAESERAYRLATLRFREGADDLLAVLDAQRSRLSAQDGAVQARQATLAAGIGVFRAVGGGF